MSDGRVDRAAGLAAGAVVFAGSLLLALGAGDKAFVFDGRYYVELAGSFTSGGSFSLTNFDDPVRGYSFPLILRGVEELRAVAGIGEFTAVRTLNAALLTIVVCVLAPRLVGLAWPLRRFGAWRQIGLAALLLVFWHGHLEWPLTDLPALTAGLTAIVAAGSWRSPAAVAVAGAAAGLAVNFRPAYVLLVPAVLAILVWNWREARERAEPVRLAPRLALLVVAIALVSLPQSLAMHRHHGTWSPLPGAPSDLAALQLTYGLTMQRYDTYIGDRAHPRLVYADPAGMRLLGLSSPEPETRAVDYREYLRLMASDPIAVAGSIGRHLVNGLDARHATPYVERLNDESRWHWRLLGFTVIWLAVLRLAWPRARRRLGPVRWRYLAAVLLTCVTTLPSAMETRFLLPLCLLAYIVVLLPAWPAPRPLTMRAAPVAAAVALSYVAFVAVAWLVVSGASDNLFI